MTNNKFVTGWIEEMAAMTQPDNIVWIDGLNSKIFEEEFILYLSVVISNMSGSRR